MKKRDTRIKTEKPVGIITKLPGDRVTLSRFHPSERLAPFVEHYWTVRWELEGHPPFVSQTLPHPSVHLVFGKDRSEIVGVQEGRFSRRLEGSGHVFAVKFRPGGFFPFMDAPVSTLKNRFTDPREIFGRRIAGLEKKIMPAGMEEKIALAEDFLLGLAPVAGEELALLHRLFARVVADRELTKVEQLAELAGMPVRSLQRLFSRHVGVSPKWVIRRYRLHDALEQLKGDRPPSFAALAAELGYADQAHFIRDFKKLVGRTPGNFPA